MDTTLKQLTKGSGRKGGKKGKKPRKPRINGPAKTEANKKRRTAKHRARVSKWTRLDGKRGGLSRVHRAAVRENRTREQIALTQEIVKELIEEEKGDKR